MNGEDFEERIYVSAELIKKSNFVVVLTGAGISAESGIPTFRGKDGLWNKYSPQELATPQAFYKNPSLVWQWYSWRRKIIKQAKPNAGHYSIARIESIKKEKFYLITQNIDGLHLKAGSKKVIEFHGNIFREKCISCDFKRYSEEIYEEVPRCEKCGNIMRPDVVWFGEPIPQSIIEESARIVKEADLLLSVGTSGVVYPAAGFIEYFISSGKKVIEINIEKTPFSDLLIHINGKAGEILPKVVELLEKN
jgi:NAD-dependent deacetylase